MKKQAIYTLDAFCGGGGVSSGMHKAAKSLGLNLISVAINHWDIAFMRMLKPKELAAAHSFPDDYVFCGTKTEQHKQIGNSVPVNTAKAMCEADLRQIAKEVKRK